MYQVRGNGFGQQGGGPAAGQAAGEEDWEEEITGEQDGGIESRLENVNLDRVAQTFGQPEPTQETEKGDNGVSYEEDGAMIIEVPSEDIRRIIGKILTFNRPECSKFYLTLRVLRLLVNCIINKHVVRNWARISY